MQLSGPKLPLKEKPLILKTVALKGKKEKGKYFSPIIHKWRKDAYDSASFPMQPKRKRRNITCFPQQKERHTTQSLTKKRKSKAEEEKALQTLKHSPIFFTSSGEVKYIDTKYRKRMKYLLFTLYPMMYTCKKTENNNKLYILS